MYPYRINWTTQGLAETHEDSEYGCADTLLDLKNIIYKYIDEYLEECEKQIKNEIQNYGTIGINRFYEMVNSEPYMDYLFISIHYFDGECKMWKTVEMDETELNDTFLAWIQSQSIKYLSGF